MQASSSCDLTFDFEELPLLADKSGLLAIRVDGKATIEVADTSDRESWSINRIFVRGSCFERVVTAGGLPRSTLRAGLVEIARDRSPGSWWGLIEGALLIRKREEIQEEVDAALADDGMDQDRAEYELGEGA